MDRCLAMIMIEYEVEYNVEQNGTCNN